MKVIIRLVLSFLIFGNLVYAYNNNKYFFGLSMGLSHMHVEKNDKQGVVLLTSQPADRGIVLDIEGGYSLNKSTFLVAELSYQKYKDVKLYNYLFSFNKRLDNFPHIYLGLVTGISSIKLIKSHINLPITDKNGDSLALGFQVGYEKPISHKISFFTQYRFLKASHKTMLDTQISESEFIRNDYSTFLLGFRWKY